MGKLLNRLQGQRTARPPSRLWAPGKICLHRWRSCAPKKMPYTTACCASRQNSKTCANARSAREDFLQHATADLILALLPTLDAFDRALRHRKANVPEQFYQGLELIHRELTDVLSRAGLTALDTLGKTFDPHLHQAVETVEAPDHRDQEIVEELQRGYKLKQRLLRPAVVKVAVAKRS